MSTDDNNKRSGGKKTLSGKYLFKKRKAIETERDLGGQPSQQKEMTNEEMGDALIQAAYYGDADKILELREKGADINYICPKTGRRPLHFAASHNAMFAIDALMEDAGLDHLVKDPQGRLPSALAVEIASNPQLGERLMQAEIKQATGSGIDYRTLLTDVPPGGDDPSP